MRARLEINSVHFKWMFIVCIQGRGESQGRSEKYCARLCLSWFEENSMAIFLFYVRFAKYTA